MTPYVHNTGHHEFVDAYHVCVVWQHVTHDLCSAWGLFKASAVPQKVVQKLPRQEGFYPSADC